eukprot:553199_1
MYFYLILTLGLLPIVYSTLLQPHVVYDMRDAFENGKIKSEHIIKCHDTKHYTDINFASTFSNGWFQFETEDELKNIQIFVNGSSNEWLYLVYDTDQDASNSLLTISSLVELCHECDKDKNSIDISFDNAIFAQGTYWIGADGNFTIFIKCQHSHHIIDDGEITMISLLVSTVVAFAFGCIAFAIFKNYVYKKQKTQSDKIEKNLNTKALETAIQLSENKNTDNDNDNPDANDNDKKEELSEEIFEDEEEQDRILVRAVIKKNAIYEEILNTIDETIDDEDLDSYQILAFREHFTEQRNLNSSFFMFRFTRYQQSLFTAFVTMLLQIFGITLTLYSVSVSYWQFDMDGVADCEWQKETWEQDWAYKILAFLWAWIISLSVAIYMNSVAKNGLNELTVLAKKKSKNENGELNIDEYYKRLNLIKHFVNIPIIEFGVIVNYYTLIMAILGSFFLIYESEAGADALDMILNAVALYFMIELDDMLVSKKDIRDLKRHKKQIMQSIINDELQHQEDIGSKTKCVLKCSAAFKYTAFVVIFVSMVIAPFAILTCW